MSIVAALKAVLISSSPMTWVIIGSISILPVMYMSTILGTSVRPLAPPKAVPRLQPLGGLGAGALLVACLMALPIVSVATNVFSSGTAGTWAHLASTVLPDYIVTTLWLCLGVASLAARITDRFRLLNQGERTALPRQQTLQALIDWSHELLSEPERVLLRRLSQFAGGWTIGAAEVVCGASPIFREDVVELLTLLVEKSLVVLDEATAQPGPSRSHG